MNPLHLMAVQEATRAETDGRVRVDVERRAFTAGSRAPTALAVAVTTSRGDAAAHASELGRILIHLRRTGAETYDAGEHTAREWTAERIDPIVVAGVLVGGHLVDSRVRVVG